MEHKELENEARKLKLVIFYMTFVVLVLFGLGPMFSVPFSLDVNI